MYRGTALDAVAICGESFDEDFFACLGLRSGLPPARLEFDLRSFLARHRCRVTAERRSTLPKDINHSVKNRFLLRLNSIAASLYGRDFGRSPGAISPSLILCFCESGLQSLPSCTFSCISRGIFPAQIDSRRSERRYCMLVPMISYNRW